MSTSTIYDFTAIFKKAQEAAEAAAQAVTPPSFLVGTAVGLSDEIDYSQPTYILEGLCGFAWINIKPARGPFVTWLKKQGIGRTDSYEGGYRISSSDLAPSTQRTQSVDRKEAAAEAFAKVLRSYGISAYAGSRLD